MFSKTRILFGALALVSSDSLGDAPNWWTGENVSLGGALFPSLNFTSAFGTSSAENPALLAVGHHDPDRKGWTIQNVEFGLAVKFGEHVSAFGLYAAKINLDDHWDDHFEEYYLTIDQLPGDVRIRGGRLYTVFGLQNDRHPHEFDWVDQYLLNGRFIGEDALTIYGGEVSSPLPWTLPAGWTDRLTASFGAVPDVDEHAHDPGSVEHDEPEFEPEGALAEDWLANVDYTARYEHSENHRLSAGVSVAIGKNNYKRNTQVYGLHLEYRWSENGHEEPGRWFTWRTEVALRHFWARTSGHNLESHVSQETEQAELHDLGHENELEHEKLAAGGEQVERQNENGTPEISRSLQRNFTDLGVYSTVMYGWSKRVAVQARAEWVSGTDAAGIDERWRLSPGVTWRPADRFNLLIRAQYNYDYSSSFDSEHSVWTQFVLNWGGDEHVHEH